MSVRSFVGKFFRWGMSVVLVIVFAATIEALQSVAPHIVALSAHDSSDTAISKIRTTFGDRYRTIGVAEAITF